MSFKRGLRERSQTGRLLDFPTKFQPQNSYCRFCNNGTPVILKSGLKTTGLGGKYLNYLVVEWMFVIDVPSKNHKPINATRRKEALEDAHVTFLWTLPKATVSSSFNLVLCRSRKQFCSEDCIPTQDPYLDKLSWEQKLEEVHSI